MSRDHQRAVCSGFTLVELLVVIAIIGVLISLLLPAVQQVREAARRIVCANNVKQLSLATLNFESAQQRLPEAGLVDFDIDPADPKFDPLSGQMLSWVVVLLPYIEQQALYDDFDLNRSALDQPNEPQEFPLPSLICPSDQSGSRMYSDPTFTNGKRFAKGNYAAFVGPKHVEDQFLYPGAISGKGIKLSKLRDGLSNTLMLSEVRTREHEQDQRGAWALPWNGSTLISFDMHDRDTRTPSYEADPRSLGITQPPNAGAADLTGTGNIVNGSLDILYNCPDMNAAQIEGMPCGDYQQFRWLSAAPRSRHAGGVNVAYADGHTRFYPNGVDEFVMAYEICIDDGQVTGF